MLGLEGKIRALSNEDRNAFNFVWVTMVPGSNLLDK